MGPWDLMDKLYASLASGSGAPDVSEVVRRMFSKYGERGGMVDLTERIARYKNDVLPTAWMQAEYNGKIWGGMPDVLPGWVVYNREVFDRFGLKPAQLATWDDFIAAGKEMKKADVKILHASVPAGTWGTNHWTMFLNSRRGNIFTPEGKVIRNNDLAKQMFRWYFDIQDVAFQTPVNDPSTWVALKQGKLATYTMNVPSAIVLKKQAPELSGKMGLMAVAAVGQIRAQGHRAVGRHAVGHPEAEQAPGGGLEVRGVPVLHRRGRDGLVEGRHVPAGVHAGAQVARLQRGRPVLRRGPALRGDRRPQHPQLLLLRLAADREDHRRRDRHHAEGPQDAREGLGGRRGPAGRRAGPLRASAARSGESDRSQRARSLRPDRSPSRRSGRGAGTSGGSPPTCSSRPSS